MSLAWEFVPAAHMPDCLLHFPPPCGIMREISKQEGSLMYSNREKYALVGGVVLTVIGLLKELWKK